MMTQYKKYLEIINYFIFI